MLQPLENQAASVEIVTQGAAQIVVAQTPDHIVETAEIAIKQASSIPVQSEQQSSLIAHQAQTITAEKTDRQPQTASTDVVETTPSASQSTEKSVPQNQSTTPIMPKNSLPVDLIFPQQLNDNQRKNSLILLAKHDVSPQAQLLLDALATRFSLSTW